MHGGERRQRGGLQVDEAGTRGHHAGVHGQRALLHGLADLGEIAREDAGAHLLDQRVGAVDPGAIVRRGLLAERHALGGADVFGALVGDRDHDAHVPVVGGRDRVGGQAGVAGHAPGQLDEAAVDAARRRGAGLARHGAPALVVARQARGAPAGGDQRSEAGRARGEAATRWGSCSRSRRAPWCSMLASARTWSSTLIARGAACRRRACR